MIIPDVLQMLELRPGADSAPDARERTEEHRSARRNEPPAAAAVNTMLESKGIKVTFPHEQESKGIFYKGIAVNCKSWMCSCCRMPKGLNLRKQLLKKVGLFKVPRLYTVTVNRDYFESPKAAYEYVMQGKFLARLLTKEMGVLRWFWVLEVQEDTGEGWPHWHILIDVGDLPGMWYRKESQTAQADKPGNSSGWCYVPHFFDLNKVHRLLHKWKIGEQCKLSVRRDEFQSPEHAIKYITKYLIKPPKRGFPAWMLKHKGLRFYQPSKAVGSIADTEKEAAIKKLRDYISCAAFMTVLSEIPSSIFLLQLNNSRIHQSNNSPVDRIAKCGKQVLFVGYCVHKDKIAITKSFIALKESIPLYPGAVCIQNFDFLTLRSFPVWGFKNIEDVQGFQEFWSDSSLQSKVKDMITVKRNELLQKWAACA